MIQRAEDTADGDDDISSKLANTSNAIDAVILHLHFVYDRLEQSTEPDAQAARAGIAKALAALQVHMRMLLIAMVTPLWNKTTDDVKEFCRKAGVDLCP